MKTEKQIKPRKEFTFWCILVNKREVDEKFDLTVKAFGLASAKSLVDDFLQDTWGWITKQTYRNEQMHATRYWDVRLTNVVLLEE